MGTVLAVTRRELGWLIAAVAVLPLALSLILTFDRQGDPSIRDFCDGPTIKAYFHPQPKDVPAPDPLNDDLLIGPLCNEDAVKRIHEAVLLLAVSLTVASIGVAQIGPRHHAPGVE